MYTYPLYSRSIFNQILTLILGMGALYFSSSIFFSFGAWNKMSAFPFSRASPSETGVGRSEDIDGDVWRLKRHLGCHKEGGDKWRFRGRLSLALLCHIWAMYDYFSSDRNYPATSPPRRTNNPARPCGNFLSNFVVCFSPRRPQPVKKRKADQRG